MRCDAYLNSKPLAVRRFARCNDVGGALQPAENVISSNRKGIHPNLKAVLLAAQRASVPSSARNKYICACTLWVSTNNIILPTATIAGYYEFPTYYREHRRDYDRLRTLLHQFLMQKHIYRNGRRCGESTARQLAVASAPIVPV